MLRDDFIELCKKFSNDLLQIEKCWIEIESAYNGKKRFYHNLDHLQHLLQSLDEVKHLIHNREAVSFAMLYHDIVYDVLSKHNEEESAKLAAKRLEQLEVSRDVISKTEQLILATKQHSFADDGDVNFFTDADLSVLGAEWNTYLAYSKNIRKEYAVYPSMLYKPGRRKVINHFLAMNSIFKTNHFFSKFENRAKENLLKELQLLD